jgi:hypothetical protein
MATIDNIEYDKLVKTIKLRKAAIVHQLDQIDPRVKWRMSAEMVNHMDCCAFPQISVYGVDIAELDMFHDMQIDFYSEGLVDASTKDKGFYLKYIQETPINELFDRIHIQDIKHVIKADFEKFCGPIPDGGSVTLNVTQSQSLALKALVDCIEEIFKKIVLGSTLAGIKVVNILPRTDKDEALIVLDNGKCCPLKEAIYGTFDEGSYTCLT